jgi:hypothetical protein
MTPFRREVRAARRPVVCDAIPCFFNTRWIEAGQSYIRLVLPPRREPNYGDHWWPLRLHLACEQLGVGVAR